MEVTQENFYDELDTVAKNINSALFLSADGEFTGLISGEKILSFDTPEERYRKLQQNSLEFLMVQFGLSTFEYCSEKKSYISHTYNFYIYPRQEIRSAPDVSFLCQSSSLQFLAEHGFDFNKVIYEGVPYLRTDNEEKLRQQVNLKFSSSKTASCQGIPSGRDSEKNKSNISLNTTSDSHSSASPSMNDSRKSPSTPSGLDMTPEQRVFINGVTSQVESFLDDRVNESLDLEPCTPFHRKLIYQLINSKYQSQLFAETKIKKVGDRSVGFIYLTKADDSKRRKLEQESEKREYESLDKLVGFTKVVKLISESGKLLIGHNMLLDMLHIISQFLTPLPDNYQEFKHLIHSLFPKLIDTKVMASTHPFREHIPKSSLEAVANTMSNEPFVKANIVVGSAGYGYENQSRHHEAGYDSFITGSVFISMLNYMGKVKGLDVVLPDSPLLQPFINKLHLMRVQDIPYMDLTGEDIVPDRSHVFYLVFPNTWKAGNIHTLFENYGPVYICWIDDTSAFVSLNMRSNVPMITQDLMAQQSPVSRLYQIQTFAQYKQQQQQNVHVKYPGRPTSLNIHTATAHATLTGKRRTPSTSIGAGGVGVSLSQMMSIGSSPGVGSEDMIISPAITTAEDIGQPIRKKSKTEGECDGVVDSSNKLFTDDIDWD